MALFWILAALAAALAGLLVLAAARRGAAPQVLTAADASELAALEQLRDRGQITLEAFAEARAEAGRRLLAARRPDARARQPRPGRYDGRWVLAALGAAMLAAVGLYLAVGRPGLADQAYARRVEGWAARPDSLEPAQRAAVAGRAARDRPQDPAAWVALGAARFEAGDPVGAASSFRRALTLRPDDAQTWAWLGESLVRANRGAVGADAEAAFVEALRRDPGQLGARYFLGEAALARGEAPVVRLMWGPLIQALDPADPRRADLLARLPPVGGPADGAAG